jgi:YggT family protein
MTIKGIILQLLTLFEVALFIRLVIDYIRIFARNWRPNSLVMALFEVIYSLTEPAMSFVRRFIPPLRIGGVALDLSFIVLIFAINTLQKLISVLL